MTRRPGHRDPTAAAATTNAQLISPALRAVMNDVVLLVATVDLSERTVREIAGTSRARLYRATLRKLASASSVTGWGGGAYEEIREWAEGLPQEVKADVRKAEQAMLNPCEHCNERKIMPMSRAGGRPQRHCSNACRQAAYRARKKASAPG